MRANVWSALLSMSMVLLVLLALSFPALEPGSPSWTVAVASLVLVLATMAGVTLVLRSGWRPFEGA